MFSQLKAEIEAMPPSFEAGELDMTRLLVFPPGIRQLLTWMMRQRVVQVEAVAEHIGEDVPTTQALIDRMIQKGLLEEARSQTGTLYQVPIRSSRNYRVPVQVWKAIDE